MDQLDSNIVNEKRHYSLELAVATDVGMRRDENQDAFGYVQTSDVSLYIVADGMGGARGGAQASALAVSMIAHSAFRPDGSVTLESIVSAIEEANVAIFEQSQGDESLMGMGTTVVVLAIVGSQALIAHVGDSRIYFQRGGQLVQLTRDHTLVQDLVDSGAISEDQAANHPIAHMLTRSLGPMGQIQVDAQVLDYPLEVGDRFLLCCDGLYNHVNDETIQQTLSEMDPREAVPHLVYSANMGGGTDNITVELLEVRPLGAASPPCMEPPPGKAQFISSELPETVFDHVLDSQGLDFVSAPPSIIVEVPEVSGVDVAEFTDEIKPSITVPESGRGAAFDNIIFGALKSLGQLDESELDTLNNKPAPDIPTEAPDETVSDEQEEQLAAATEEDTTAEKEGLEGVSPLEDERWVLKRGQQEPAQEIEQEADEDDFEEEVEEESRGPRRIWPVMMAVMGVGIAFVAFQFYQDPDRFLPKVSTSQNGPVLTATQQEELLLQKELERDSEELIEQMADWVPPRAENEGWDKEQPVFEETALESQQSVKSWPEVDPMGPQEVATEEEQPEVDAEMEPESLSGETMPEQEPRESISAELLPPTTENTSVDEATPSEEVLEPEEETSRTEGAQQAVIRNSTSNIPVEEETTPDRIVAIDWSAEQARISELRLKAQLTSERDTKVSQSLTEGEVEAIIREKGEIREAIASINDKLLILELRSKEEIAERMELINEELLEIGESIQQVRFTVNNARRRQEQWLELKRQAETGDPFKLVKQVAASSGYVREGLDAYRRLRRDYDEAVRSWRANRQDTRLAARMARLGKDVKTRRALLERDIRAAIKTGLQQSEETVSESIILLEELSAREARLNKQIGFGQTTGDPSSRLREKQREILLSSLAELTARLEKLDAQIPEDLERKERIDAARGRVSQR